jgi:hypothetical protein
MEERAGERRFNNFLVLVLSPKIFVLHPDATGAGQFSGGGK